MLKGLFLSLFIIFSIFSVKAQGYMFFNQDTNSFYRQGEMNIEFAPTTSSENPFNFHQNVKRTYGYELETEYWQSKNTGTGLSIGLDDSRDANECGGIGYISINEDIRIISFDKTKFLDRFAIELQLGTGNDILTGNKYFNFGPGFDFQITEKTRLQLSYRQDYMSNPSQDTGTFKLGLQYIF